ncbi:hypothetical protein JOC86_001516 [Bacillus pakistanensis]|uniref:Uncharacterized protein n=2 Tax=Rossellomorea pakistanensis TaxID=992288 RepID=A0ABS2NAZ1_9BACI|nr:hypothetical protein [Bacillus pakistanensis]
METLKISVIGGGSITYLNTRFALHALEEFTEVVLFRRRRN